VRLLVVHTAEGSLSIESLGSYFASSSSGVSSHAGADDKLNTIGVFVERAAKAWTQGNANPVACSLELCAFAAWDAAEWNRHPNMLANCAAWLREEAAAFGVPLQALSAAAAQSSGQGVCQHIDLGSWGGGHVDCGPSFPLADVLAQAGGAAAPAPPPSTGAAPPFPYPADHYLGQPSSDPRCHSGYYGGVDHEHVRTWQTQMSARGWVLDADGYYGPHSEAICWDFQEEQGLSTDGLCGPQTWAATW
jgi:hypothetical protein